MRTDTNKVPGGDGRSLLPNTRHKETGALGARDSVPGETCMAVVCDYCRQLVQAYGGFILTHGHTYHGRFVECAGSRPPVS